MSVINWSLQAQCGWLQNEVVCLPTCLIGCDFHMVSVRTVRRGAGISKSRAMPWWEKATAQAKMTRIQDLDPREAESRRTSRECFRSHKFLGKVNSVGLKTVQPLLHAKEPHTVVVHFGGLPLSSQINAPRLMNARPWLGLFSAFLS